MFKKNGLVLIHFLGLPLLSIPEPLRSKEILFVPTSANSGLLTFGFSY